MGSYISQHMARQREARQQQLRDQMHEWRFLAQQRDKLIRQADACGISRAEISRDLGIAKTTVLRVLAGASGHDRTRTDSGSSA